MNDELFISICIITLGRSTIYRTLESIFSQKIDKSYEIILVLQGTVDMEKINHLNIDKIPLKIFNYAHDLWFGYYRNQCIKHANGDILVWIDDDEWSMNKDWLFNISSPIIYKKYDVVTSGYYIPLGQWYLTDCISLLWWPGGGALWFRKMWTVKADFTTKHICSGNFAIKKSLLQEFNFPEEAKYGWEDNALSSTLHNKWVPVFYQEKATVYHIARSFRKAIPWWVLRIKSMRSASKKGFYEDSAGEKKIRFIKNIFAFDLYLPWKLFCFFCIVFLSCFSSKE